MKTRPTREPTTDVMLFATVGGNSGLLATLAWALSAQRSLRVSAWHTVLLPRGLAHMQADVLAPGGALDRLHARVGPDVLPREGLRTTLYDETGAGADLPAARDEHRYVDRVLSAAREALAAAGERPVVFALVAGRDRVMTLALTVVAQFLARPTDLIVDLRVDPPNVVAGGAYYLPEAGTARGRARRAAASDSVRVHLVDVPLPRLRSLLSGAEPETYAQVLRLGQQALLDATPARMVIDLSEMRATVEINGVPARFSPAEKLLLAALALAQEWDEDDGFMRWPIAARQENHPLTEVVQRVPWVGDVSTNAIQRFLGQKLQKPGTRSKVVDKGPDRLVTRDLTNLGQHLHKKLVAYHAATPGLPQMGLVRERVSLGADAGSGEGYWRVRTKGLAVEVIWPGTAR